MAPLKYRYLWCPALGILAFDFLVNINNSSPIIMQSSEVKSTTLWVYEYCALYADERKKLI